MYLLNLYLLNYPLTLFLVIYPKNVEILYMYKSALFIITIHWKKIKSSSTDKGINKFWYLHTIEYYSTIRRTSY